jgi:hypothetical protein
MTGATTGKRRGCIAYRIADGLRCRQPIGRSARAKSLCVCREHAEPSLLTLMLEVEMKPETRDRLARHPWRYSWEVPR